MAVNTPQSMAFLVALGSIATVAVLLIASVDAHIPIDPACVNTSSPPELISYHIHILFMATNTDQVNRAMQLQHDFAKHFQVPIGKDKNCTFPPGDPHPQQKGICAYPTSWEPEGPFPTAQYSFFIPQAHYTETVQWVLQRRNGLDLLVHPNSGCELQDHSDWAMWGGRPWELNMDAFHCDSPGCIPPP
eukprot:gene5279-7056_t